MVRQKTSFPMTPQLWTRDFDALPTSHEFLSQWQAPGDVFSILLLLGGDVIKCALAQLSGSLFTPVAFSFGWVAYAVNVVTSAIGENKLLPLPDSSCLVINGKTGYSRENKSWVLGRLMRDFESWCGSEVKQKANAVLMSRWSELKADAERECPGSSTNMQKPAKAGLCVAVYKAKDAECHPVADRVYYLSIATIFLQLSIAAIPFGVFGDWSILLVTGSGTILALATGSLPQWAKEKWACRMTKRKTVIITYGQGHQYAIVIINDHSGNHRGFDLESLAAGTVNAGVSMSITTRMTLILGVVLWTLLLITAAGIKQNTWFLVAVGGIGILQNIFIAGAARHPKSFGLHMRLERVFAKKKTMKTLYEVEETYKGVGKSMICTFFPGELYPEEKQEWTRLGYPMS